MWTFGIVEAQILSDAGAGFGNVTVGVQVDLLIFYRSPQALDEDIVPPGAFAVHGDGDGCVLQHLDKVDGRELAALVHCPAGYCEAISREGVLKISGFPCRVSASFTASMQKSVSRVMESRQDRTLRLYQSTTAAR
jgi:hypothetical protein